MNIAGNGLIKFMINIVHGYSLEPMHVPIGYSQYFLHWMKPGKRFQPGWQCSLHQQVQRPEPGQPFRQAALEAGYTGMETLQHAAGIQAQDGVARIFIPCRMLYQYFFPAIHTFQYNFKSPLNKDGITNLSWTHFLCFNTFAGFPLMTHIGGTSLTTTAPAPITAPRPILRQDGSISAFEAIHT